LKQITIRVDKYGKISNIQDLYLKFANENLTTEVTVDFEGVKELYNDYVKYAYIFVGKTKRGTFYTSTGNTLTFLLTQEDLQTGYITIQPAAKLPNVNPELIKHVQWEHVKFDVKKSFDPIIQDTTVTCFVSTNLTKSNRFIVTTSRSVRKSHIRRFQSWRCIIYANKHK